MARFNWPCLSANITAEQQRHARFSHPYREEETAIVIRWQYAGRGRGITPLEQLINTPDFHIGVLKCFDYGKTFRQLMARPELQPRLQIRLRLEQLLKMLQGGRSPVHLMLSKNAPQMLSCND